ncbi:MAG: hypothetical protein RLZZ63_314 [Gemmatimonadota bacterium]
MSFLTAAKGHLINIPGWRTSRHLVVIESDDWGMVRTASRDAYTQLLAKGHPVDTSPYSQNDCLESNEDLTDLLEVLCRIRDHQGNPAVVTINNVVGNPDFRRIRESEFTAYFVEPFTETLERYPSHDRVMELYRIGMGEGCFVPQFHGREHVHVTHWMQALRDGATDIRDAFDRGMFTIPRRRSSDCGHVYVNAMFSTSIHDEAVIAASIAEGLRWFTRIWGFASQTAIAPCYQWSAPVEEAWRTGGVRGIQSAQVQQRPTRSGRLAHVRRYTGQVNTSGQTYAIRNVMFEPSLAPHRDAVPEALRQIARAFLWRKPAIIASHRLNYIGSLQATNKARGLSSLTRLLTAILRQWPDVEFIGSDQLHRLMQDARTEAHATRTR